MEQRVSEAEQDSMLARAAQGDAHAWRELVHQYTGRVYGLIYRQCRNADLAEEITQATFVKVVSHLGDYKESGRFEPWLFRIAMNLLRDEMRRQKRQARTMDTTGDDAGEASTALWQTAQQGAALASREGDDPFEHVARQEQVRFLQQAVASLGEADREILYLRHTAGLSFPEIAESLGQPLGTVLARGHRALAKVKKLMFGLDGDSSTESEQQSKER